MNDGSETLMTMKHRIEQVNILFRFNWFGMKNHCLAVAIFHFVYNIWVSFGFEFILFLTCGLFSKFMIEISILKIALNSFHCICDLRIAANAYIKESTIYFPQRVFILIETDNRISNPSEKAKPIKPDWKPVKWIEFFMVYE